MSYDSFWISHNSEYSELSKQIICFSSLRFELLMRNSIFTSNDNKNKYRSTRRLNVEADLRVAVSIIKPNLGSVVSKIQAQVCY